MARKSLNLNEAVGGVAAAATSKHSKHGRGKCQVCAHDDRASIDSALRRGMSVEALAKDFHVHIRALYRHKAAHVTDDVTHVVAAPEEAPEAVSERSVLARLDRMARACERLLVR